MRDQPSFEDKIFSEIFSFINEALTKDPTLFSDQICWNVRVVLEKGFHSHQNEKRWTLNTFVASLQLAQEAAAACLLPW